MGIKDEVTLKGVEKYRECPDCWGTGEREGHIPPVDMYTCPTCNGTGEIVEPIRFDEVEWQVGGITARGLWWLKEHLSMWKVRGKK